MSQIPSNLARVPNLLTSQTLLANVTRTNVELLRVQTQLATGKRLNAPSDDPLGAALVNVLESRLRTSEQRQRNLFHGASALSTVEQALSDSTSLLLDAKRVASEQVGVGSDSETRAAQAVVVESLIRELTTLSAAQFSDLYVFAGSRTGEAPIEGFLDGYRYVGAGDGLVTDLGPGFDTPITIGADRAFGSLSTRIESDVDLNPVLTRDTHLSALRGAGGLGVRLGTIDVTIDDGTPPPQLITVDLTDSETVGDALDRIEADIRAADPAAFDGGFTFPGGAEINAAGTGIELNVAAGYTITISDIGSGTTAGDLGLDGGAFAGVGATGTADLDAQVTAFTRLGDINPAGGFSAGDIVIRNGGQVGTVSLGAGTTVGEFRRLVAELNIGARVEISADGTTLAIVNELSGSRLSIEESGGGTLTATSLGLRTLDTTTALTEFNDGRGVEIADGAVDPTTGLADPDRNVDFRVTLADGRTFDVDLTPADVADVGSVLAAINAAAGAAAPAIAVPGEFEARLADGANGISFLDNTGGAGPVTVESLNGFAAEDLGLLDGVFAAGAPAVFAGEDRAKVRVDSVFSTLIDLKVALERNDERGITLAGERLETDLDRLATTRAVVGGRIQRIDAARAREEDANVLDAVVKSRIEDLDFAEGASRFALLQLVQQAGFTTVAQSQSLSLLNFLG